jgi:magnesium-protoporphyrin O-methyltransferase
MHADRYLLRRAEIETYFDRTASDAWARLTSTEPLGHIRATVRAGRDRMRATLLDWLPADLRGARLLDAGCGTGALALAAAQRGAHVVAVDLSATLVQLAQERQRALGAAGATGAGRVEFLSGDMLDPALGAFDYVVGMDSLIHYESPDAVRVLDGLAARTSRALLVTFAPGSPALHAFKAVGKLFPRGNRSPAIVPVAEKRLRRLIADEPGLGSWQVGRMQRVSSGFYTSQAWELVRR